MTFPVYDVEALSTFVGRPEQSFTEYADQAIADATLLFRMATCLEGIPESPEYAADLVERAILALADRIYLSQPHAQAMASPYTSENLGAYGYSKAAATSAVVSKENTGVFWFDEAVSALGVCDTADDIDSGGGIEVFEGDGQFVAGSWPGGSNTRLLGPEDMNGGGSSGWHGYGGQG